MDGIDKVSVIIPSLNPSETIVHVVSSLIDVGFRDIIVVDDGSGDGFKALFDRIGALPGCSVLTHSHNLGKGAALKTAFSFFLKSRPGMAGVLTMDGDGQHLAEDAARCAQALLVSDEPVVLGARDFLRSNVPKRNSLGNRTTAFAFRALFGIKLRDTQTGLRGIPARHIPMMLDIPGKRFEYETNMLLEIERRGIPFLEVEIETVYEQGSNDRSHYRPLVDSLIIFSQLMKYALSSLLSFFVDIGLFWLAILAFAPVFGLWSIPACTAIARVISSFFNFNINRFFVFRRKDAFRSHLWRYYALALTQMLTSAAILWVLALAFIGTPTVGTQVAGEQAAGAAWLLTAMKMLTDTALFFASFYIQRIWVFRK